MRENSCLQDKVTDKNWVLKRKRKRVSSGLEVSKEKESISPSSDSLQSKPCIKKKPRGDTDISRLGQRIKGHDGYYFECEVCDLGGNLLCCDCCPRTYHLECLDPPLKRAPPGKWQCPSCCEQKNDVKPLSNVETSSKRARSKSNFEKRRSLHKLSGHDKPELSGRIPTTERNRSGNKGKTAIHIRVPSMDKKPGTSPADISYSTKSSPSSDTRSKDGVLAVADSSVKKDEASSQKEAYRSVDTLNRDENEKVWKGRSQMNRGEKQRKKDILSLVRSTQITSKERHKTNGVDKKKRSRSRKGKHGTTDSGRTSKETSLIGETSELLPEDPSLDQQNSASITRKATRVLKLSIKKRPEMPHKEAFPSSHVSDDIGEETDKTLKSQEYLLEGVQQVDRILGCRLQASTIVSSCHAQAVKSIVSAAVVNSTSDSEKVRSPSCSVADPENGCALLDETNDGTKAEDETDVKGLHDKDADASADDKIGQVIGNKDDIMIATASVKGKHTMQGSSQFPEESAVSSEVIVDAMIKVNSEGVTDTGTVLSNDGNHQILQSHDSEVTKESIGAQADSNLRKEKSTQVFQDLFKNENTVRYEFLVKWVGQSNVHNSWIAESQLKILAKRKLENYKAKYGTSLINICEEQWCEPQRVIALRVSKDGTKEALTKWHGLPYDECTWERLDEPVIEKSAHLVAEFEKLEFQTLEKDAREAIPRVKVDCQEVVSLTEQPKELQGGSLFPHQLEALNWLRKCWHKSKNVILADEMGLGKTVSACAFLSSLYLEFKATLPCLVLVPLSTMPNWMAEFTLWAPHLNVVEYHGPAKARSIIRQYEWHATRPDGSRRITSSYRFNVLLTTYEMVLADSSHLRGVHWEVLIVDEGHRLKNSGSKLFSLLNTFSFQHRVLLTGTPLQNNIGEMYNLLNFLQPVSFPSLSAFEEKFNDLTTAEKVEELKKLVAPHMLRRLKKDAMQNIPPKTERMVPVELTSIQAEYYRAMLTKNYQILRNAGKGGVQQSMLNIVMQLRKVCNHPYLIPGTEPESGSVEFLQEMRIKASAKLTLLHSMLKILHREGHRVLIFSQMTKLLDILEDYLVIEFGPRTFERVDGSVSVADRQSAIVRFNQDKSRFVFLLSTRSCGLGINLATADTVIIYDSDFNPHADIQAMNRAHRIGQSNRLLVYRLVVRASVEERILQLAKKKLMLDQLFVNKSESQKEVEDIIRWGTEELFNDCDGVKTQDLKEASGGKVETVIDGEHKHRRRSGGLGDVYKDRCGDSCTKIVWDENAISKLLDRTNLQSSVCESADGDMENDMLGAVKSLDWNDDVNDEAGGTELLPDIDGDALEEPSEAKEDNIINVTEENEWDRLLRLRWEKYQTEEEAALGRGKRQRKAVSYKETFAPIPNEVLSESGNEEGEPEPVYTPAGRALKEKYAKLRARQKERIAQRHNTEVVYPPDKTELSGEPHIPPVKEAQSSDAIKLQGEARQDVFSANTEETKLSQPFNSKKNNSTAKVGRFSKHGYKRYHSTQLDLSVKPSGDLSPDIFLPSHQLPSGTSAHLLPVLGLCAPNASQMNTVPRKSHSISRQQLLDHEQRKVNAEMYEVPVPPLTCLGSSNDLNHGERGPNGDQSVDLAGEASQHHMKNIVPENFFPFVPPPPSTSGKVLPGTLENSSGSFSSFQERLGLPNLNPEDNPLFPFSLRSKAAMKPQTDCLPSLSLGTIMEGPSQDFMNIPFLPSFSQHLNDTLKQKHKMDELPPTLGLGQMHANHPSLRESHKKVLDNIMMRTRLVSHKILKKRLKVDSWTEDELDALWIGVRRHGRGSWDAMLRDPKLKFSRNRTADDLGIRWIQEQQKIMDGPTFAVSKSSKPDFLTISDGMMNRALFGSRFASTGAEPPRFRSHITDIQLACGERTSGFPFAEPTSHLGAASEGFQPLPAWLPNKPGSSYSDDLNATYFHRPEKISLPLDPLFQQCSVPGSSFGSLSANLASSSSLPLNEDDLCGGKKPRLPSFLDKSLNLLHDSHSSFQSIESNIGMSFNLKKKQVSIRSPSDDGDAGCSSNVNKLPHWLREAVNVPPSKPPEPHLPSTVSAIAQSVRLLYGEDKPTIPPFSIPGPAPKQPKDPRKSLKKKRKLQRLQQETSVIPDSMKIFYNASSSSLPLAPPIMASTPNVLETNPSLGLPSLNLNLNSPSSSKSSPKLEASPEVLPLETPSVPSVPSAPTRPDVPGPTGQTDELRVSEKLESELSERVVSGDVEKIHGILGASKSSFSDCLGKLKDKEVGHTESGDSIKAQSGQSEANQIELEEISSEKTFSDEHKNEHEP